MNNFEVIFKSLRSSFDALWSMKIHSEQVIEVITPFATTAGKFVSIFITQRNAKYIVSDGGTLASGLYNTELDYENQCLLKMLHHYEAYFSVQTTEDARGFKHYYKSTNEIAYIPSVTYQLAQYISLCVSAATVPFMDEQEKKKRDMFKKEVNTYLKTIIPNSKITLNGPLDRAQNRAVRFNAIVTHGTNSISLINYITGSDVSYFTKSISNAVVLFEIAENSIYKNHINRKIAVINNTAEGYVEDRLFKHIELLESHIQDKPTKWTEKDILAGMLN